FANDHTDERCGKIAGRCRKFTCPAIDAIANCINPFACEFVCYVGSRSAGSQKSDNDLDESSYNESRAHFSKSSGTGSVGHNGNQGRLVAIFMFKASPAIVTSFAGTEVRRARGRCTDPAPRCSTCHPAAAHPSGAAGLLRGTWSPGFDLEIEVMDADSQANSS